jgi:hypothetical protein
MIFFGEIYVFLQLKFIGPFGANTAYLHNENYGFQEVFLSKTNSILTWKPCATHQKDYSSRPSRLHPRDAEVVQHMKINKCNKPH